MTPLEYDLVTCPVCGGTKISRVTNRDCTRCGNTGHITRQLGEVLAGIRLDMTDKLSSCNEKLCEPQGGKDSQ